MHIGLQPMICLIVLKTNGYSWDNYVRMPDSLSKHG